MRERGSSAALCFLPVNKCVKYVNHDVCRWSKNHRTATVLPSTLCLRQHSLVTACVTKKLLCWHSLVVILYLH